MRPVSTNVVRRSERVVSQARRRLEDITERCGGVGRGAGRRAGTLAKVLVVCIVALMPLLPWLLSAQERQPMLGWGLVVAAMLVATIAAAWLGLAGAKEVADEASQRSLIEQIDACDRSGRLVGALRKQQGHLTWRHVDIGMKWVAAVREHERIWRDSP